MNERELNLMAVLCEEIDQFISEKVRNMMELEDKLIAVNTMVNVSTTTLAKAMLLVREETRQAVMQTAISITYDKIKEGDAMVNALKAVLKAQSMGSTCQPWPPTKH